MVICASRRLCGDEFRARMIRVHMRQQDGVDLCRIDSSQGQILRQLSVPCCQPPAGMDGKGIMRGGEGRK
jgi:hypothetical protein